MGRGLVLVGAAIAALLTALLAPCSASADDSQAWFTASIAGPVAADSNVLAGLDVQARFRDHASELDVATVQPSVGWRATSHVELWLGASEVQLRRPGPDVRERRLMEQMVVRFGPWLEGRWSSRTRLEQRVRDSAPGTGWRLREQVKYAHALEAHPSLGVVVSDELFYAVNDAAWGQHRGIEQNRAFVGGSWQATPHVRVEAGYLNQHARRPGSEPDLANHVALLTLAVAL